MQIKLRTDKEHRKGRTFSTSVGNITFDRLGMVSVDIKDVKKLMTHDESLSIVSSEDEAEVEKFSYPEDEETDFSLSINDKEKEILNLKQEINILKKAEIQLNAIINDKDTLIKELKEKLKETKSKLPEASLTASQLQYKTELESFELIEDLKGIAHDTNLPKKEWDKLDRAALITYLVSKVS